MIAPRSTAPCTQCSLSSLEGRQLLPLNQSKDVVRIARSRYGLLHLLESQPDHTLSEAVELGKSYSRFMIAHVGASSKISGAERLASNTQELFQTSFLCSKSITEPVRGPSKSPAVLNLTKSHIRMQSLQGTETIAGRRAKRQQRTQSSGVSCQSKRQAVDRGPCRRAFSIALLMTMLQCSHGGAALG